MVVQRITYSLVCVSTWGMLFNRKKACSNTKRYLLLEEERDKIYFSVCIGTKLKVEEVVKLEV